LQARSLTVAVRKVSPMFPVGQGRCETYL